MNRHNAFTSWLVVAAALLCTLFVACAAISENPRNSAIKIALPSAGRAATQSDITRYAVKLFTDDIAEETVQRVVQNTTKASDLQDVQWGEPGGTIIVGELEAGSYAVALFALKDDTVFAAGYKTPVVVAEGEATQVSIELQWNDTAKAYEKPSSDDEEKKDDDNKTDDKTETLALAGRKYKATVKETDVHLSFTSETEGFLTIDGNDETYYGTYSISEDEKTVTIALAHAITLPGQTLPLPITKLPLSYSKDNDTLSYIALGLVFVREHATTLEEESTAQTKATIANANLEEETAASDGAVLADINSEVVKIANATGAYTVAPTAITSEELSMIINAINANTTATFTLDLSGVSGITSLTDSWRYANINELIIGGSITTVENICVANEKLQKVTIGNSVTTLASQAFCLCSALEEVTLDMTEATTSSFRNCSALKSVTLGEHVEICELGTLRPDYAAALTTIISNAATPPKGQSTFKDDPRLSLCTQLTAIYVPAASLAAYKAAAGWSVGADIIKAIGDNSGIDEANKDENLLLEIAAATGEYTITLTETTRARLTKIIAAMTANEAASFTLDLSNVTGITELSGAWGDANIDTLIIGGSITAIDAMLCRNSTSLRSLTIGSNVETIGALAFQNCTSLETLTVNGGLYEGMHGQIFRGLTALRTLTIGHELTTLTGDGAGGVFSGYSNLQTLKVLATTPPAVSPVTFTESVEATQALFVPAEAANAYAADVNWNAYGAYLIGLESDSTADALTALAISTAITEIPVASVEEESSVQLFALPSIAGSPNITYTWTITKGDDLAAFDDESKKAPTLTLNANATVGAEIHITVTATDGTHNFEQSATLTVVKGAEE